MKTFKSSGCHIKHTVLWHGFIAMILTGCMGATAVPEDHYYRLPPITATESFKQPIFENGISVAEFALQGLPDSRSILYIKPEHPHEINTYYYRHWVDTPTELVQSGFVEYLRSTGVTPRVEAMSGHDPAFAYMISGNLQRFERELTKKHPVIIVAMEIIFTDKKSTQKSFQKIYQAEIPADDFTMDATVASFAKALGKIYRDFTSDLSAK